jgi:MFS family permease
VEFTIVGAPLAGRISDRLVKKWRKRRAGEWVPEDRLRGTLFGAVFLVPVSVLFAGIITHYVGGNVGLGLNLVCLFLNGLGVGVLILFAFPD